MNTLEEKLSALRSVALNPKTPFKKLLDDGRKVIGCMPYFAPEELIYAAGMVPFGLWGGETQVSEAKRYWPTFICSILQTTLELGIRGGYDGMTAVMVPALCDALKGMEANWRYAVPSIPVVTVAHAQNRKTDAGTDFTASQYRKIRKRLEALSGSAITDEAIAEAVKLYNGRRAAMRRFMDALSERPGLVKPSLRNAVFKSSYFMDVLENEAIVLELTELIERQPKTAWKGPKLVTSGIVADNTGLLSILDGSGVAIVDDEVTHESLRFRTDVPVTEDPILGLAEQIGHIEGCSVLFDPGKNRGTMLIDLVRKRGADGVLFVQTKFCDPEEYDYVPLKRMLDQAGIRSLLVEVDQQAANNEQARTALEAFSESMR